jgi:hypothetical protein
LSDLLRFSQIALKLKTCKSLNKVPEIGFGHKMPKLNFVSHIKISQENLRKNQMTKHTSKRLKKVEKPQLLA